MTMMMIVLVAMFYYCGVQITMELVLTIMPIFVSFFAFVFVFVFSGLCLCFLHNRPQFSTGSSQMAEKGKKNTLLDHKNYTKDDIYAPFWFFQIMDKKVMGWGGQSRINHVSASAMLTEKFLQIRKVFCDKFIIG